MGVERLKEIAQSLRAFGNYTRSSTAYRDIEIEDDYYEFDLGQFGSASTSVTVRQDSYELDIEELLEDAPLQPGEFEDLAVELEEMELVEESKDDLDTVLTRLEEKGEGPLVRAIRAIVEVFKTQTRQMVMDLTGLSVGALPPKPLPWPGALRPIDYTAADFPLRYDPPPGHRWAMRKPNATGVEPSQAEQFEAEFLRSNPDKGYMVMDNKGRISWRNRGDDDLAEGKRWSIWFLERDGIPRGNGDYNAPTLPLAIDANGDAIGGVGVMSPWLSSTDEVKAKQRLVEIQRLYEIESMDRSPVNEYGVRYDPLSVALEEGKSNAKTEELRLGDLVLQYGRVTSVRRTPEGGFVMTTDGSDGIVEYTGASFSWNIKAMALSRESQPTALSLSEGKSGAPYDPLTAPLNDYESSVLTEELRLGEDITGPEFGRVLSVTLNEGGYLITMNRDGEINTYLDRKEGQESWSALLLAEDRDKYPTALSLSESGFSTNGAPSIDYDPKTVLTKADTLYDRMDSLRLGDRLTGAFGRVVGIEGGKMILDDDGTERKITYTASAQYYYMPIDVLDRDKIPTAAQLAGLAGPVPAPF